MPPKLHDELQEVLDSGAYKLVASGDARLNFPHGFGSAKTQGI